MISIAVHIIFVWVLNLTMHAQTVKEPPIQTPEIREEIKTKEIVPTIPIQPEMPPSIPKAAL